MLKKNRKFGVVAAVLGGAALMAWGGVWAAGRQAPKKAAGAKAANVNEDCTMPDSVRKQVLAQIGKTLITVGSFADEINRKSPYLRARYGTLERRKDLLEKMVERELLAVEAARRGLDKDPDVQRTMKQVMIQKLLTKVFKEQVESKGVPEEALKKFYQDHFKEYNKPEQVRVSQILLKDKATADKVLTEARKAGMNMRTWRDLVRKYSTDRQSKIRGGDLRYFDAKATRLPKALVAAAFKLRKPGQLAGPIKTDKGFAVIRLTHRRQAFKRTLGEVKPQIKQRLLREKRSKVIKAYVEDLKKKAKITIDAKELASLKVDTTAPIRSMRRPGLKRLGPAQFRGPHGRRRGHH
ncbi:MAG: peptidyl-prolyl cis-trans isomerase [Deltaproteobacteria bacterium]|nr:peptidyl-prolyl cis-trans isomerase [Deltaproteobacteria bacterium]